MFFHMCWARTPKTVQLPFWGHGYSWTYGCSNVKSPVDNEWRYRTTDQRHRRAAVLTSHMLVSLLSLLGEGFAGSLAVFPLAETAASTPAATAVTGRLLCSSLRASGLGCEGGACSSGSWTVRSCCSLWLCSRRSWTRSSKMASCSSWMAWFRWVFLFCTATISREASWNTVYHFLWYYWVWVWGTVGILTTN